ncbi:MAG TPA: Flp pilus assembly protein CpaB [Solirubrobacteraceae bacterium]|jgi:pilus assembly protein CpaB
MTARRRRAALLVGLALLLGGLAASDVARREAAVEARLAPLGNVVVAATDIPAGTRLAASHLAVRRMPLRFAPAGAAAEPEELVGRRVAVAVPRGGYLAAGQLDDGQGTPGDVPVRRGERAAEVVGVGSADLVRAGARVDLLVTRGGEGAHGSTRLALEDVEVLAAEPAPPGSGGDAAESRVRASLRVTLRQAVFLAAAQAFAREVRLLPRAPGDRGHGGALEVGEGLR